MSALVVSVIVILLLICFGIIIWFAIDNNIPNKKEKENINELK